MLFVVVVQIVRTGLGLFGNEGAIEYLDTLSLVSGGVGFLHWYEHYDASSTILLFGGRSFEGLYDLLGIHMRVFGQYTDTLGVSGFETANLYTVYRGLIEDFSLPGALVLYIAFGFVSQSVYRQVVHGNAYVVPILSIVYAYTIIGTVNSMFIHNSLLFAPIIVSLLWRFFLARKLSKELVLLYA